jgi:hypothetical protein
LAFFDSCINNVNWNSLVNNAMAISLDNAVEALHDGLKEFFDACFPPRIVRARSSDPPWINHSLPTH